MNTTTGLTVKEAISCMPLLKVEGQWRASLSTLNNILDAHAVDVYIPDDYAMIPSFAGVEPYAECYLTDEQTLYYLQDLVEAQAITGSEAGNYALKLIDTFCIAQASDHKANLTHLFAKM